MNDSDDELLSGMMMDDDEEEDWNDTTWAQPPSKITPMSCRTKASEPKKSKKSSLAPQNDRGKLNIKLNGCEDSRKETEGSHSPLKALKESIADTAKDSAVVDRMSLNDNKAGMEGLDKARINQIIHEASKGSKFYENERKKEEQMKKRIEEQKLKIEKITDKQLQQGLIEADQLLEEFERYRDLNHTIVHIDMDAFYAAVEMRDDPSLKNKPMAVGGTAMLSTSNYHARKFGVRAAMPGFIGKKLCPDLIIIPTNFDKYTAVSKQVRSIMSDYDPNFCPMSLDEAYLDITEHLEKRQFMAESERTFLCRNVEFVDSKDHCLCDLNIESKRLKLLQQDNKLDSETGETTIECEECEKKLPPFSKVVFGLDDEAAVQELRTRIEQRTRLTASAGIAPNMMLAKVCSDKNKPNGQYKVPATREAVLDFIKHLSTRKISGIGKVSETMLNAVGVFTCTDLYEKRALLYHLYSPISFNYLMRICLGIGSTTVERDSERKSISTERTFSEISKPADLYKKCEELCEALAEDLKEEQLKGKTVSIKLKTVKFEVKTRAQTLADYTRDKNEILSTATDLLKTEIQVAFPQPLRLRLMGVRMSSLLHQSLCKNRRQNTITGLLKKMSEKKVQDSSLQICVRPERTKGDATIPTATEVARDCTTAQTAPVNDLQESLSQLATDNCKQSICLPEEETNTTDLQTSDSEPDHTLIDMKTVRDKSDQPQDLNNNSDRDPKSKDSHIQLVDKGEVIVRGVISDHSQLANHKCENKIDSVDEVSVTGGPFLESSLAMPLQMSSEDTENLSMKLNKDRNSECEADLLQNSDSKQELVVGPHETQTKSLGSKTCLDTEIISTRIECPSDTTVKEESLETLETEEPILYTPRRHTRSGLRENPKGIEKRKRRNSKKTSVKKLIAYVCPVCCQKMLFKDLNQFNEHIDDCIAERDVTGKHFPAQDVANKVDVNSARSVTSFIQNKAAECEDKNSFDKYSSDKVTEDNKTKATDNRNAEAKPQTFNSVKLFDVEECTKNTCEEMSHGNDHVTKISKVSGCPKDLKLRHLDINVEEYSSGDNTSEVMVLHDNVHNENVLEVCDVKLKQSRHQSPSMVDNSADKATQKEHHDKNESVITEKSSVRCILTASHIISGNVEDVSLNDKELFSRKDDNIRNTSVENDANPVDEIKFVDSQVPTDTPSSLNNDIDLKNQCDTVSSTNETIGEENSIQLEPELPYLNLDLLQNDDDFVKDNSKTKSIHHSDFPQISDTIVDSTTQIMGKTEDNANMDKTAQGNSLKHHCDKPNNSEKELKMETLRKTPDYPQMLNSCPSENQKKDADISDTLNIDKASCSFEVTQVLKFTEMETSTSDVEENPSLLVCPICNIEQRVTDLGAFNTHVDSCLSRGTISEILKKQNQDTNDKVNLKRNSSSVTPVSSQKSSKRQKTNSKQSSCRSIASFFQTSEFSEEK